MREADLREVRRNEGGREIQRKACDVMRGEGRSGRSWGRERKRRSSVGRKNRGGEGN